MSVLNFTVSEEVLRITDKYGFSQRFDESISFKKLLASWIKFFALFLSLAVFFTLVILILCGAYLAIFGLYADLGIAAWTIVITASYPAYLAAERYGFPEVAQWNGCQRKARNLIRDGKEINLESLQRTEIYDPDDWLTRLYSAFCLATFIYLPLTPLFGENGRIAFGAFVACYLTAFLLLLLVFHRAERLIQQLAVKEPSLRQYGVMIDLLTKKNRPVK